MTESFPLMPEMQQKLQMFCVIILPETLSWLLSIYLDPPPVMSWWSLWGVMAANCGIHDDVDGWTLGECLVGDNTQMDMLFWSFLHNLMNAFCSR
jgi:hypothetical protein